MLFAQAETTVEIFERFGVSVGMLIIFTLVGVWVAKRLLNEKNGLFTHYVNKTTETMESIGNTCQIQAETGAEVSSLLRSAEIRLQGIEETQTRIEVMHYDPHSKFATTTLSRCFLHGCDVLEAVSEKLEILEKTGPLIKIMKTELKEHERETRKPVET